MTNNETDHTTGVTATDDPTGGTTSEAPERAGPRLPAWANHPVARVAAVLVLAPALFLLGRQAGIIVGTATDGEPRFLLLIGVGVAVLVALVAVGAWVDTRRKRRRD